MSVDDCISLSVLTPEGIMLQEKVSKVELPGGKGRFTVLKNHMPLISSLTSGKVAYCAGDISYEVQILSGFVEIRDNVVTVCAEVGR